MQKVDHEEKVCTQSSYNKPHNTNSYNNYLSLCNTWVIKGSPSFNRRGSPNNEYMHSRYNQQQDTLNQYDHQGQTIYPLRPINIFNTYQRNQSNSDRANGHIEKNFCRKQIQASISQQMNRNSSKGNNAVARHFNSLRSRSSVPANQNVNQDQFRTLIH